MADSTASPATRKRRAASIRAEADFFRRVAEQGGTVLGTYVNSQTPVHVRCALGHDGNPRPASLAKGNGLCWVCSGRHQGATEQRLRALVAALGGEVIGPYLNGHTTISVRCGNGHKSRRHPQHVLSGGGICRICVKVVRVDTSKAESRFRDLVTAQGGEVLSAYATTRDKVLVRCANGHENEILPRHTLQGVRICRVCGRRVKGISEPRFREFVAAQGGAVVGQFVDMNTPVLVRCAKGHEGWPRPSHTLQGIGICHACANKTWDVFYVVRDSTAGVVKFGITSGDPRPRLGNHASNGLRDVIRVVKGLPHGVAREMELVTRSALGDAGMKPVRGREYFADDALPLILDLLDHHPAVRGLIRAA